MKGKTIIVILSMIVLVGTLGILLTFDEPASIKDKKSTILYVGGAGPFNYSSIQAAIDDAGENYTIFIYPGVYFEHLKISKPLTLYGESVQDTIIDLSYNGTGMTMVSDGLIIDSLHFRKAGGHINNSLLEINRGDSLIKNCIFENARHGILLAKESRATIKNCTFYHTAIGIRAIGVSQSLVTHCNFIKNGIGVLFTESSRINLDNIWGELNGVTIMTQKCNNVSIANCILFNGNENQVSLYAEETNNIHVGECIIYHSGRGIRLSDCDNAIIRKTHLYDSKIGIETSDLSSLHIEFSRIHNNDVGIYLYSTEKVMIANNDIYDNSVANLAGEGSSGNAGYNWWGGYLAGIRRIYFKGGRITTFPCLGQKSLQGVEELFTITPPRLPDFNSKILYSPGESDMDGDGAPDWWETKYGYNPLIEDSHSSLDPDQDGLNNIEEYLTDQWGSKPFNKDLFLEIDVMDTSYEIVENKLDDMRQKFANNGIALHIDNGPMGGGQITNKIEYVNYVTLIDLYWKYFLCDNPSYWRKGVFHYVLLSDSLFKNGAGFVFIGWDEADAFALSMSYYQKEIPKLARGHVLATVFMHELGHTLGLFHDVYRGIDNESSIITFAIPFIRGQLRYWHYQSCMNYQYAWQVLNYSNGDHGRRDFDDWSHINLTFFQDSHWGS